MDDAVEKVSWSKGDDVLKVAFLVGDAPPHMDYPDDVKHSDGWQKADRKDLIFDTAQCGAIAATTPIWQEVARLGEGSFTQLGQTGDMVAIPTPMDAELADLNRQMVRTLVPFGVAGALRPEAAAARSAQRVASEAAPASVTADRLSYNMNSGKAVQGDDERVDAIAAHRVALKDLKDDQLPADLRALHPAYREARIKRLTADRAALRDEIAEVSERRDDYLAAENRKRAESAKADSFDGQFTRIISEQAARHPK